MDLAKVQADVLQLATDLGLIITAPTTGMPAIVADWWNPTPEQYSAFAAKHGVTVASIQPWVQDLHGNIGGSPFPVLPAVSVEADVFEYAGFGFGPDGKQRLFTEGAFLPRRAKCDELKKATTPAQADFLLTGAGAPGVEPNAVRLSLMTGLVSLNPFITPSMAGGPTVADLIAQLLYVPASGGGPGPGIAGR